MYWPDDLHIEVFRIPEGFCLFLFPFATLIHYEQVIDFANWNT